MVDLVRQPEGWLAVEPRPSAEELADFYANAYFQQAESSTYQHAYDADELAYKQLYVARTLHLLEANGARRGTLVELGVGEGFLLAGAAEAGWTVEGVDFSAFAVEQFNPQVAELVHAGDALVFAEEAAGRGFDACVLHNVLEHVVEPDRVLDAVRCLLAPDGLAVVVVPNDDSMVQHRLMDLGLIERDAWFAPPQHLNYFNVDTGPAFALAHGFDVVDVVADFPIDWLLFHPGSNYWRDKTAGKAAHRARMELEQLHAARGLPALHRLGQALAECGSGRQFSMVLRPR